MIKLEAPLGKSALQKDARRLGKRVEREAGIHNNWVSVQLMAKVVALVHVNKK